MKRIVSILCALTLLALSAVTASAVDRAYRKGDADMDGSISVDDATHMQRILAELARCDSFWAFFTADADNNGKVDINDVSMLQRELAEFETTLNNIPDGNATIAQAAVTMAYEHKGDGLYAPGKKIYLDAFELSMEGDDITSSCDRFVCTAVRWSGADDHYPVGHVGVQADYLDAHTEKWMSVFGSRFLNSYEYRYEPPAGLEPGDVVIEYSAYDFRSHTFVYCGEGLIASIFPNVADRGYNTTSASYDDTAPECRNWYLSYNYFRVFRCKQYETNPRYKYAGLVG